MTAVMAGQILFSRTSSLISGKLQYPNRASLLKFNSIVPFARPTSDSKSLLETYKIPDKPKKPLTSYLRFVLERRPILLQEHPSVKSTDLVKLIAEQWKALSPTAKQKYEEEVVRDKEKYKLEIASYNAKLTSDQRDVLDQIRNSKLKDRKQRKLRKENKAKGKPKRPVGLYGLFVRDHLSSGKSVQELLLLLKGQWEQLSEVERDKYQIEYNRNWEKYQTDLEKWEKDCIAEGQLHLVRSKTLKKSQFDIKEKPMKTNTE